MNQSIKGSAAALHEGRALGSILPQTGRQGYPLDPARLRARLELEAALRGHPRPEQAADVLLQQLRRGVK